MAWFSPKPPPRDGPDDEGEELQGLLADADALGAGHGNPPREDAAQQLPPRPPGRPPARRREELMRRTGLLPPEKAALPHHLDTIDWSRARAEARRHEDVVEAKIRGWPVLLRSAFRAYDACQSWLALGIIGASCGVVASIIDTGTDWATDLKFGLCRRGFWISKATCCSDATDMNVCPAWNQWAPPGFFSFACYVVIAVAMGSYSAWITQLYPFARGSGLPEIKVIMGGFVMQRLFGFGTLLTKSMGLVLAVGAGLSIGKEGPFVHVAMCVAQVWAGAFSKYAANQGRQRELLSSAAAAGVAVAFGAPVGGVLFSLEEVSSYFPAKTMFRAFWCALIAVLTMQHLNQSGVGKLVMFEVRYHHQWKHFEMLPFLLLGALGGLIGAAFNKLHRALLQFRRQVHLEEMAVAEVALLAFLTATLNYHAVYLRSSATGLLAALFSETCVRTAATAGSPSEAASAPAVAGIGRARSVPAAAAGISDALCQGEWPAIVELLVCGIIKVPLSLWASSAPVPGGILIPSLVIGALLGRAAGLALQLLQISVGDGGIFSDCAKSTQCITPGVYAMVGAAAVLAGVTRSTVSLVVIMMEVTGGLEYVLPIMAAIMVSKWVGDVVGGRATIYDNAIEMKAYPHLDHNQEPPRNRGCVRDVLLFAVRSPRTPTRPGDGPGTGTSDSAAGAIVGENEMEEVAVVQVQGDSGLGSRQLHVLEMHGNTCAGLRRLLVRAAHCSGLPVVVSHMHPVVVGFAPRDALEALLQEAQFLPSRMQGVGGATEANLEAEVDVMAAAELAPLQVDEDMGIDRVMDMFVALGLRFVLVTSRGLLKGIVTKKDLLHFLNHGPLATACG